MELGRALPQTSEETYEFVGQILDRKTVREQVGKGRRVSTDKKITGDDAKASLPA